MRINTNMNAMTALNSMNKNTNLAGAAMGKISSGLRINKAGDDAAGLAISEKMRSQIRGLDQASRNTQDGVSLIQTAEGATEEIGNITQRMRELSVQASNETNSGSDREKIVEELNQLHSEIDRIADSTQFNGKNLLNGSTKIGDNKTFTTKTGYTIEGLDVSGITAKGDIKLTTKANGADTDITVKTDAGNYTFKATGGAGKLKAGEYTLTNGGKTITLKLDADAAAALTDENIGETTISDVLGGKVNLQVGANEGQQLLVQINNLGTESLGIAKADIDAIKADNESGCKAAQKMITTLDKALEKVNTSRANFGAMQNRLESAQSNLSTSSENLTAAESRIRDVDVAKEMMTLSKFNLLTQASQAMAAQAKSQPEGVMQLLR
ncbi:flagellar hook-associated protein FlgL [Clostridium sardiniense]|uniref:flagellar hook-associated protein FlgL n=1 Tax=Clostridium sardiniense TaxID=29369 RepID=UPI00195AD523|nr:flagellar hook-associated protein FlgL [Clostridium sardiniense]MBM7835423.1 flagellin [Clostridium sardiniense]